MAEEEETTDLPIKMSKLKDDPCFGEKYEEIEQCKACWVKNSCHMRYKNRKPADIGPPPKKYHH